jgi:biopolymer transport protein TolR
MAEMNVVPYIDVMLVLLIIFMITSTLLVAGVDVELPHSSPESSSQVTNKPNLIIISVNAQGLIFLQDGQQSYNHAELLTALHSLLAEVENPQVLVRGDRQAHYGYILGIIDLLKSSGIKQVSLITQLTQQP